MFSGIIFHVIIFQVIIFGYNFLAISFFLKMWYTREKKQKYVSFFRCEVKWCEKKRKIAFVV